MGSERGEIQQERFAGSLALPPGKAALALLLGAALSAACCLVLTSEHWAMGALLSCMLCWAAVVDVDRFILPDMVTLGLTAIGLVTSAPAGSGVLAEHVIGAVTGYVVITMIAAYYARLRGRNGIGLGDAKLFASAGAWLGWQGLPFVMLVSSIIALAYVGVLALLGRPIGKNDRIAFGPFLAVGIWLVWVALARDPQLLSFGATI